MKKNHIRSIPAFLLLCLIFLSGHSKGQEKFAYPFQNPDLPVEERIDNLISLMTLDEKVACLSTNPSVPRLGVKASGHVEGLHGLSQGGAGNWGKRYGGTVPTTTFPQSIGLAMAWDVSLIKKVAEIESTEARFLFQNGSYKRGGLVIRAPNADLGRDPRWGRNEECYGEDPWLNAQMVVAFVQGLQGDDPVYWRSASLMKHFLANSNENGRDSSSSDFDERLWREYYSFPFWKGVVQGGSRAYMAAYNAYNGIPSTVHPMLKNITVNEWGQNGIICTDGGAYRMLVNSHRYFPGLNLAAAGCIHAGINQFLDNYREGVYGALANHYISEGSIDSVIRGNFRVMIKLGLLDPPDMVPYASIGIDDTIPPWEKKENREFVREVTRKSVVLLKNNNGLLPLDKNKIKKIAVIGPVANRVFLDWYSGTPPYAVSPLEGIKNSGKYKVEYVFNDPDSALTIASQADIAVVFVGNHPVCFDNPGWKECDNPGFGREAVDREIIELDQEALVKSVYTANKNTVMVLISSFPYAINWSQKNIPAILHMAHNSQETGNAIADVLFGGYNPAGRLVQTWPLSTSRLPDMMDYNIRNGRTYMYNNEEVLYPFGHGLSYTNFGYGDISIKNSTGNDSVFVSFNLVNTGDKDGEEVVQLYISYEKSGVTRPIKQLKDFKRVFLEAGETKNILMSVSVNDLAYWDTETRKFEIENGKIKIMIGPSSADIKLADVLKINL